jgi:Ser/Thr protein kinase RdoA (MazF antagonist)
VHEEQLPGNATAGVVRVGDTVRRPAGPWTDAVDALLTHLHAVGFPGAPRPLGRDDKGRQVLEYVPGQASEPGRARSPAQLRAIGRLLRDYHRAVADFRPPPDATWNRVIGPDAEEIICHGDPAPWNLIESPRGWVLVDWDGAGPGSALWDLAYAAQTTVPLEPGRDAGASRAGLRAIVDGYDLDEAGRRRLVGLLGRRAWAMHDMLRREAAQGRQPWARIWVEDGPYWRGVAEHLDAATATLAAALL